MLKRLLTPPIPYTGDSFFEEAKYLLAYRSSFFLTIILGVLSLTFFFLFDPVFYLFTMAGFLGILIGFIHICLTGKFKTTILLFNLFAAALCQTTLYTIPNTPHIADSFWMMVNIVFALITIPRYWAYTIAFVHGTSSILFYMFFYNEQLHLLQYLTFPQLIGFGLNLGFTFFITAYLTWQNIHTTRVAESKLQQAHEKLLRNNEEMSLMLKEIHHRVKNNLQIVISLLRLQSNELRNPEAIEKFNETINRVIAMAKIHEKMYRSEQLARLDLRDYFTSLVEDMIASYNASERVKLEVACSIRSSDIKFIVPLGLLFNELISNSLKHAFHRTGTGNIHISMSRSKEELHITYKDSGEWQGEIRPSFGFDLIETLVEQLNGTYTLAKEPTCYQFTFFYPEIAESDPYTIIFADILEATPTI